MLLARSNKAAGGFFGFQKAASEPARKEGNLQPPDKHLGKQGCNYQFRNHKIFNPHKSRLVNISPSVFVHVQVHQFCIILYCQFVIHYLSVVICHLAGCFIFVLIFSTRSFQIHFCSVLFVLFYPIIHHLITLCYFLC
jgi:hypothetical protein